LTFDSAYLKCPIASEIVDSFDEFIRCQPNYPVDSFTSKLSKNALGYWNRYLRIVNFASEESAVDDFVFWLFKQVIELDVGGFDVFSKPSLKLTQGNSDKFLAIPDICVSHTKLNLISCLVHENKSPESKDAAFPQVIAEAFASFQRARYVFWNHFLRLDSMNLFAFVCQGLNFSFLKLFITERRNKNLEKGQELGMNVYRHSPVGHGFSLQKKEDMIEVFNSLLLVKEILKIYARNEITEVK